jgi:hypothetical protein
MPAHYKEWNGDEWQEHIGRLLRVRYSEPGMYQEMPSRDKGDLGLEGFAWGAVADWLLRCPLDF